MFVASVILRSPLNSASPSGIRCTIYLKLYETTMLRAEPCVPILSEDWYVWLDDSEWKSRYLVFELRFYPGVFRRIWRMSKACSQTQVIRAQLILIAALMTYGGPDNSVVIATSYGPEGPGIESQRGRNCPHPSRPALELIHPPMQWVPGLFPEGKVAGAWRLQPTFHVASRLKKE